MSPRSIGSSHESVLWKGFRPTSLLGRTVAILTSSFAVVTIGACDGRWPLARADLRPFKPYEQRPSTSGGVRAYFLGTSSILFRDSATAILGDGFVTRPGLMKIVFSRIAPDTARVRRTLKRLGVDSIAAIYAAHTHYDHVMDAPEFARATGGVLLGSPSTMNVGRGVGLPERQMRVVRGGETLRFGKFSLTFIESRHTPGNRSPGIVDAPLVPPARQKAYKSDTTWAVLIEHDRRTILVHPSTNFVPGEMRGRHADVVYLGIARLSKETDAFVDSLWNEVVRTTRAKRVILVHWDDFFRSLDEPLRPMPFFADDIAKSIQHITRRAARDSVEVLLPVPWQPTDPFAGLPIRDGGVSPATPPQRRG
jgi:L-ascorbate metabolism protein UlaG (beta-lactamase superfamily)